MYIYITLNPVKKPVCVCVAQCTTTKKKNPKCKVCLKNFGILLILNHLTYLTSHHILYQFLPCLKIQQ